MVTEVAPTGRAHYGNRVLRGPGMPRARIEDVDDQPVLLWKMRRDAEEIACRVRLAPYGIEVDMLNDGAVVLTRVFATDDEALSWARERHGRRESEGWQPLPVTQAPDNSVRPA